MFSDATAAEGLSSPEMLEALFSDFGRYETVGLAVSGGPDSVAMMRLAQAWAAQRRMSAGQVPALVVITVDHGLRAGSGDEARAVGSWAADLGLAHEVLVWRGTKPKAGVQEAARAARFDLLTAWAQGRGHEGAVALALAHHNGDQAETVLMRLARGSGTDGLAAMRRVSNRNGVVVLRPLLDLSKADLVGYLEAVGASWIEDPSNQSLEFERVRLRAEQPSRARMGLSDQALSLTARRLARAADALAWSTDEFMAELMAEQPYLGLGGVIWPREPDVPAEVAIRALGRVLNVCGGTQDAGPGQGAPGLGAIERLADRMTCADFAGATLGRCQVSQSPLGLVVHRETARFALPTVILEPGDERVWDGRYLVGVPANGVRPGAAVVVRGWDAAADLATDATGILPNSDAVGVLLRAGQPVFWCDGQLVAMPTLHTSAALSAETSGQLPIGSARFLSHGLVGRG